MTLCRASLVPRRFSVGGCLGHTARVVRRRLHRLGVCALLIGLAACSSGGMRATLTTTTIAVVMAPTTVPLPTTVRSATVRSQCPQVFSATPSSRGVGRLDFSLVPIAAVSIEVCTYVGSGTSRTLHDHVVFEGLDADGLENAANGLTGVDPASGPRCEPAPAASVLVVASDGLNVEQLVASLAGCRGVSNGYLSAAATPTWTAALQRAIALADLCAHRIGATTSCVAADS